DPTSPRARSMQETSMRDRSLRAGALARHVAGRRRYKLNSTDVPIVAPGRARNKQVVLKNERFSPRSRSLSPGFRHDMVDFPIWFVEDSPDAAPAARRQTVN